MSAANLDVTVMVARAESRVLAAARAIADVDRLRRTRLGDNTTSAMDVWDGLPARELRAAIKALAAADEAELAEIAAHESEMQQRVADHEVWLAEAENAADTRDWYAEYEDELAERAGATACDQPVTDSSPVAATIAREAGEEV